MVINAGTAVVSRTAAFLPLTAAFPLDLENYIEIVQEAVRSASDALAIIFYRPLRLKYNPISRFSPADQQSDWDALQRFFGIIYGCAGREAAILDRPLLDVIVLVDGLMEKTLLRDKISKIILLDGEGLGKRDEKRALTEGYCSIHLFIYTAETIRFLDTDPEPRAVTHFTKGLRGDNSTSSSNSTGVEQEKQDKRHDVAALGGTFDHLHGGHKILLTMAVAITKRRLVIGLTSEYHCESSTSDALSNQTRQPMLC
jgi:hypothetical protein